eukprot:TRINITY_DN2295_c1_g2_i1.p1 TRINITY_DN2295_c1_g2~~TRINITY_DN2295_c1_g2_i1.p1  ORF type:complete len:548 (+),score=64.10 TRINITY_DN2295_c1_g2_i1:50-1693(+)
MVQSKKIKSWTMFHCSISVPGYFALIAALARATTAASPDHIVQASLRPHIGSSASVLEEGVASDSVTSPFASPVVQESTLEQTAAEAPLASAGWWADSTPMEEYWGSNAQEPEQPAVLQQQEEVWPAQVSPALPAGNSFSQAPGSSPMAQPGVSTAQGFPAQQGFWPPQMLVNQQGIAPGFASPPYVATPFTPGAAAGPWIPSNAWPGAAWQSNQAQVLAAQNAAARASASVLASAQGFQTNIKAAGNEHDVPVQRSAVNDAVERDRRLVRREREEPASLQKPAASLIASTGEVGFAGAQNRAERPGLVGQSESKIAATVGEASSVNTPLPDASQQSVAHVIAKPKTEAIVSLKAEERKVDSKNDIRVHEKSTSKVGSAARMVELGVHSSNGNNSSAAASGNSTGAASASSSSGASGASGSNSSSSSSSSSTSAGGSASSAGSNTSSAAASNTSASSASPKSSSAGSSSSSTQSGTSANAAVANASTSSSSSSSSAATSNAKNKEPPRRTHLPGQTKLDNAGYVPQTASSVTISTIEDIQPASPTIR